MSERTDKFLTALAGLWMDFSDGLEENPRAMIMAFVIGLVVCAVGVLVF